MDYPLVSIIMPIRNEAAFIAVSLGSVFDQDYPTECMEILIVDGMSTDNTRAIVGKMASQRPNISVNILDNPSKIVPTGMNIALRRAKGEIIIRVDGHTVIAPDYIHQCVEVLSRTNADNVGGKMSAVANSPFGKTVALATSVPFGIGGARFHFSDEEEWVDTVYMGAWPRRVFDKIGLFDEELIRDQDDELNFRLRKNGGKILLSPKIKSKYTVRSSPKTLYKQYFEYGYWKVRVLQKHSHQMSLRQYIPPTFVAALFCSALLVIFTSFGWVLLALVCGSYLLANLTASIITASKWGWDHLPLLPITFGILHFSYGLGFLVGLIKFWNRWGDKKGKVPELNTIHA